MKYKHHIIPRHMGGSDDPDNIVSLTITEHAEAHRILYEEHGCHEDYVAWKALEGSIGKEEISLEKSRIGGLNNKGIPKTKEHNKKVSESLTGKTWTQKPKFKWEIEMRDGSIEVVYNLSKFCKTHGINSKYIYKGTSGFRVLSKETIGP